MTEEYQLDKDFEELLRDINRAYDESMPAVEEKGGPGSGHYGHKGRPGQIGGSLPKGFGFPGEKANPNGNDTLEQYMYPDGTWTPEREALHQKIINHFFLGKTPVDSPTSYVLGGGPAAGKTTLIRQGLVELPDNIVLAAGDEIKEMLPEYRGSNASFVHEESSYLSKKIAAKAANESYNLVMDGTGDSEISKLAKKVNSLRPLGQPVIGKYVTVDVKTAIQRNIARAKATGRYMPESVLREAHRMVARVYPEIIGMDIYDSVDLYDNSGTVAKLIAREVGKTFTILDEEAYRRFLARGK